ncbi:glomulin [Anabrus simplex]|uniref:glomulin n=1 Tax=Anabrus simplex TaxID=316456 RepID=UPI0035A30FCD
MSTPDSKEQLDAFIDTVRNHLSNGQLDQLMVIIHDEKNIQQLKDTSWDVIPIITQYLNEKESTSHELLKCCKGCLEEIARKGNPEETLLEFLAEAEDLNNDVKFIAVLQPLSIVLLRLPKKRGQSMEWCFKTVQEHFKALPEQNLCYNEENVKVANKTKFIQRVRDLYLGAIPFYRCLVDEVCHHLKELDNDVMIQRKALISFLLQLLGKPYMFLDDTAMESVELASKEIVGCLCDLVIDPMIFMDFTEEEDDLFLMSGVCGSHISGLDSYLRTNKVPVQSLAVLYYLILSKRIHLDCVPCVYHPSFIFHHALHLACYLLKSSENVIIVKGLRLTEAVLMRLQDTLLAARMLDLPIHYDFTKFLVNIMVYCPVKSTRILAINLFKTYLFKFDLKGQYLLLFNLHKSVDHSCSNLRGFLMTQIKEIIHRTLNENITSIYFTGKCLCDLMALYCNVPQEPDTYLLEISDEVMSALNLIRFLILRDKDDKTGIWTYLRTLEDGFFKKLSESLKYSREYYNRLEMEAKDSKEKFSVTVRNEELSLKSEDERLHAQNLFDLIEDILERVKECLAESRLMNTEAP